MEYSLIVVTAKEAIPTPSPSGGATEAAQMKDHNAEASALGKVMWFGIIQLAGVVVSWIVGFYLLSNLFPSLVGLSRFSSPSPTEMSATLVPFFRMVEYLVPVSAIIGLASLALLLLAFRDLERLDRSKFFLPMVFVIILMAGEVFAFIVLIPFLSSISMLITQLPTAGSSTLPPAFAGTLNSLLVYPLLLGVAAVLAVIGDIIGVILGLWRVGERYDETIIRIGAIFTIIPILNIAAPVLILVGASSAKSKLA